MVQAQLNICESHNLLKTQLSTVQTQTLMSVIVSQTNLSSSREMDFAWSDTNISCVLLRDLKTRVWTECF